MPSMRNVVVLGLAVVILGGLLGCGPSPLAKIQADPAKVKGKEFKISGKVSRIVSVGTASCYTITDGKGEMLVKPKGDIPQKGKKLTVTVTVETDYEVGGSTVPAVLVEK